MSEQSLLSFITSWARTDTSTPLLNAIVKLEMYIRNLESELNTVSTNNYTNMLYSKNIPPHSHVKIQSHKS